MTDFVIIRRSMQARLFSTVVTVLMVAVSVALLLVLLTMRDSGRKAFERGSGDMHFLVSADASPLVAVLNGVFYANAPQRPIMWSKYETLKASLPLETGGQENLAPGYAIPTQQGDSFMGLPVLATTPEFFTHFRPSQDEAWAFKDGRAFNKSFEVVLGSAAAKATNLRVGDQLYLVHGMSTSKDAPRPEPKPVTKHDDHDHGDDHKHEGEHDHAAESSEPTAHVHEEFVYTVVGILEPTGGSHDRALITEIEAAWIIHAQDRREKAAGGHVETTAADLLPEDRKITGIYIRLATPVGSGAPANFAQVGSMLRRDPTITVASPAGQIEQLFKIVGNIDQIFIAMALVVMVSSGIAIMLALYNSMDQRRRQIAILRVLGSSSGRIFSLVLTESALIGMLGAGTGIALSFVGTAVAAATLKKMLGLVINSSIDPQTAVTVAAGTIILGAIAGVIPAAMAYRTSVARSLKPAS